jgi:hypothetical protein
MAPSRRRTKVRDVGANQSPDNRRRSTRISKRIASPDNQSSSTRQSDTTTRPQKGKRKLSPDAPQRANSKRVDTTAEDSTIVGTSESGSRDHSDEKPPSKCFRISGIPSTWNEDDIFRALHSIDPSLNDQKRPLWVYPGCFGSTRIALLQLNSSAEHQHLSIPESADRTSAVLTIDCHFHDLTPLNSPKGEVIAEFVPIHDCPSYMQMLILGLPCSVIAVTGLAGHAYGSWRSRETHQMWLKDFLPDEVQKIRILSYGYDSSLVGGKTGGSRLLDYQRHFIQQLENARSSVQVSLVSIQAVYWLC